MLLLVINCDHVAIGN